MEEVKYMRVILEPKLTWNQHLDKVKKKMEVGLMVANCCRTRPQNWSIRNTKNIGKIYETLAVNNEKITS